MSVGWQKKPLGSLLEVLNGHAFKSKQFSQTDGLPLIRIRDLKTGSTTETRYNGDYDAKYVVENGDLLIGMDGEFRCYDWRGSKALLNQRVCKLGNFSERLLPRFLLYGINKYLKDIEDVTAFTTVKHLSSKTIQSIQFPIPSLQEQQHIVELLDEAFEGLDRARAHAEANLQNARELFARVVTTLLIGERADDRSANFDAWPERQLKELVSFHNGDRGKNYPNKSEYVAHGIPWLNTGQILPDGSLSESKMNFITRYKFETLGGGKIQPGDLVFCLRGATIGKTAFVAPYEIGAIASSLMIIRPGSHLSDRFAYYFLTSTLGKAEIDKFIAGAAQPNLAGASVGKFKIRLPPIDVQKQIVARIDSVKEGAEELEQQYRSKLQDLDDLRQSILQKAFAGELTAKEFT